MDISYALESLNSEEERKQAERAHSESRTLPRRKPPSCTASHAGRVGHLCKQGERTFDTLPGRGEVTGRSHAEYLHALTHAWESGEKQEIEIREGLE